MLVSQYYSLQVLHLRLITKYGRFLIGRLYALKQTILDTALIEILITVHK